MSTRLDERPLRWQFPAVLLLVEGRPIFASPESADLTGYTTHEMTGPEFRFEYLFPRGGTPTSALAKVGEAERVTCSIAPLRGEPFDGVVTFMLLKEKPRELVAVLQRAADASEATSDLAARTARSLARGLRSALAREIVGLRRAQEAIEIFEGAPEGRLAMGLSELVSLHETITEVEVARERLTRRAADL